MTDDTNKEDPVNEPSRADAMAEQAEAAGVETPGAPEEPYRQLKVSDDLRRELGKEVYGGMTIDLPEDAGELTDMGRTYLVDGERLTLAEVRELIREKAAARLKRRGQ